MNSRTERLDKSFIERQRQRLTKLRDELADATQGKETEEKDMNSQSSARNAQRLAQVDRALEKIAEGTYGLSDASDHAIPRERLEATPEAIYTVAEQTARESAGLRGSGQK